MRKKMSKIQVPETTLQALFEDGRLYSMQEYIDRWPEAWTPELEQFIMEFNEKEKIEAPKRAAREAAEKAYHRWDNFTMEDFCNIAKERLHKLQYLLKFFEGYDNNKAREIDAIIVHGNNALSRGFCKDNSRDTRERFISFIEADDKLKEELKQYK